MSCISKIKNANHLTETEKKLSDYILSNYSTIPFETAQTLAEKVETSAAAIIRFSKKLGYNGFTQLKLDLAQETVEMKPKSDFFSSIKEHDPLDVIVKKAEATTINTLEQTYQLINFETFSNAIEALKMAKTIYLFGIGASAICCMDLAQKLSRIGKPTIFFQDFHTQLPASYYITENDVALAISYSGKTREILTAMQNAKEKGATTISITQMNNSALHKLSDYLLFLPTLEKNLRLGAVNSRNASLAITDLLYFGIIADDLSMYKERLTKTRSLTTQIRNR